MNVSNQVPTLNFKKLGLLAMTPIALVIHGLVLWIPVNTETKKEKEPEKKEELQAIGDIVSIAPTASPPPKAAASIALSTPSAIRPATSPVTTPITADRPTQVTQSQTNVTPVKQPTNQTETKTTKPSESTKPLVQPVTPVVPQIVTPEDAIGKRLRGVPCPGGKKCSRVAQDRDVILKTLEQQYDNKYREVYTLLSIDGTRPDEAQFIAYEIQDKKTNNFLYFILYPATENKINKMDVQFLSRQEVIDRKGVL